MVPNKKHRLKLYKTVTFFYFLKTLIVATVSSTSEFNPDFNGIYLYQ